MKPPFLLLEGGDINLFKTLEAMARYVESPDIDSYLAVDSTGTIMILSAEHSKPNTFTRPSAEIPFVGGDQRRANVTT
jgi:hypothetical protein